MKIYYMNVNCLKDESVFEEKLNTLSRYRQDKILSYRFEADRRLGLGAGILLDKALREQGYQEAELLCEYNEQGKPFYKELPDFHFNLSHSGDYAVIALSDKPVGVDIEKRGKLDEKKIRLAKKFFHPAEFELLKAADREEQEKLFYQVWTLKESYAKAVGRGIGISFSSFCTSPREQSFSMESEELCKVRFCQYDLIPGYALALCFQEDCALA